MAIQNVVRNASIELISVPKNVVVASLTGAIRNVYLSIISEPLKVAEIREHTKLSTRTIRTALRHLKDHNLVEEIPDLHDLRRRRYRATRK